MRAHTMFLFLLLCSAFVTCAQPPGMPLRGTSINIYGIDGFPLTRSEKPVEGSPYINEHWGRGYILFKNDRKIADVELNFSLAENTFYFRKDSSEFGFADELKEGLFVVEGPKGGTYLLRSQYPANGPGPSKFLQVLTEGKKYHLLKYAVKNAEERWQYARTSTYEYKLIEELYLFEVAANRVVKVRPGKSGIGDCLPAEHEKINAFARDKNYKLRSQQELIALINYLNN